MPRRLPSLAFIPLLLVAGAASAEETTFTFDAGGSTPAIPIHLASNKVHLQVAFGDREPVWMLLDSGANVTILNRELADEMGLELRNETVGNQAAGGRSFRVAFTDVPDYRVPGLELRGRTVAVLERRTQPSNGHPSRGLLGADLFRRFVVDIDYPARTIRFHDPASFEYDGSGAVVPIDVDENGKSLVEAELRGLSAEPIAAVVSIDTGGRGFLTLNAPFVSEHELMPMTVGVGVGGEVRHYMARLPELGIGPLRFRGLPTSLAPPGTTGAYGSAAKSGVLDASSLVDFRVLFDYSHKRVIFEPGAVPESSYRYDASGLFLIAEGERFDRPRVMSVEPSSPAAQAGIEVGDRITRIDGRPVATMTLDEVRELLMAAGTDRRVAFARMGARDSESEREVVIRLAARF
jgi:predicted aspartyl protease